MRTVFSLWMVCAVFVVCARGAEPNVPPKPLSVLLQEAVYQEETVGDVNAAMSIYQQIIKAENARRPEIAKAYYRYGMCLLKKGDIQSAAQVFQNVTTNFSDQKVFAAKAQKELEKIKPNEANTKANDYEQKLNSSISLEIAKSPDGDRLTVQYAAIAVCEKLGIPYQWKKSQKLAGEKCRKYIDPIKFENVSGQAALNSILKPFQLKYELDDNGLYLCDQNYTPQTSLPSDLTRIKKLIREMHDPDAPRFVALNALINIGEPAVDPLIAELSKSNNWQVAKALGALKDKRAVKPLIDKWKSENTSPMRDVIAESLTIITGKNFGDDLSKWEKWYEANGEFLTPQDTVRNFMSAAAKLDVQAAMKFVAPQSHDYEDIKKTLTDQAHPFNLLFRSIDPAKPVQIIEAKIKDNSCEAIWRVFFKQDFTIEGKTFKAGESFDIDGNLYKYDDKWLITGI